MRYFLILFLFFPVSGRAQLEPLHPDCAAMLRQAQVFERQVELSKALQQYLNALNCDSGLAGTIGPRIRAIFEEIERQREREQQATRLAEARRLAVEEQSREIQARTLTTLATSLLANGRYNEALQTANQAYRLRPTGELEQLLFKAYRQTQQPGGCFLEFSRQAHDRAIDRIAVDPTESYLLTATRDTVFRLWTIDGQAIATVTGLSGPIAHLVFSPTGQAFVTVTAAGDAVIWSDRGIRLHALDIPFFDEQCKLEFSADGALLLYHNGLSGKVWNSRGELLLDDTSGEGKPFHGLTDEAFFGSWQGGTLLQTRRGNRRQCWTPEGRPIDCPLLSPPPQAVDTTPRRPWEVGRPLLRKGNNGDNTALLLVDSLGEPVAGPLQHEENVSAYAVIPGKNLILTGSSSGELRWWRFGWSLGRRADGADLGTTVWSPDGTYLLVHEDPFRVRFWQQQPGSTSGTADVYQGDLRHLLSGRCFSARSNFVSTFFGTMFFLWDRQGRPLLVYPFRQAVRGAQFSKDERWVLAYSNVEAILIDLVTHQEKAVPLPDTIVDAEWSPAGDRLLFHFSNGRIQLFDQSSWQNDPFFLRQEEISEAHFSPTGRFLLLRRQDKTREVWTLTGRRIFHDENTLDLIAAPDDETLAAQLQGGKVLLLDASGRLIRTITHDSLPADRCFFSPGGRYLFFSFNGGQYIEVRDRMGQLQFSRQNAPESLLSAVFSPSEKWLVCSFDNSQVQVMDMAGRQLTLIPRFAAVEVSPKGHYLLLRVNNRAELYTVTGELITVWDHSTPAHTGPNRVIGREGSVEYRFSPDADFLLINDYNGTVSINPTPWGIHLHTGINPAATHREK